MAEREIQVITNITSTFFFLTMAISEFKYQFSNVAEHTNRRGKKKQDFP